MTGEGEGGGQFTAEKALRHPPTCVPAGGRTLLSLDLRPRKKSGYVKANVFFSASIYRGIVGASFVVCKPLGGEGGGE